MLSDAKCKQPFQLRHATFVIHNKSGFYIEASIKINVQEFEKEYYLYIMDDIDKLCFI